MYDYEILYRTAFQKRFNALLDIFTLLFYILFILICLFFFCDVVLLYHFNH